MEIINKLVCPVCGKNCSCREFRITPLSHSKVLFYCKSCDLEIEATSLEYKINKEKKTIDFLNLEITEFFWKGHRFNPSER